MSNSARWRIFSSRNTLVAAAYTLQMVLATALVLIGVRAADGLLIGVSLPLLAISALICLNAARARGAELQLLQGWLNALLAGNQQPMPKERHVADVARQVETLLSLHPPDHNEPLTRSSPHASSLLNQTRSLSVLYDIAAGVNVSRDLDDLLTRFLGAVSKIADTRAVAVRLLDSEEQLVLAAQVGLDMDTAEHARSVPVNGTSSGLAVQERRVVWQDDPRTVKLGAANTLMQENPELLMVSVPLQYRDTTVGVYNVFVDRRQISDRESIEALFLSIGRHLGIAIEKTRLEREAYHFHIMQERSRFSAELHDSLAQTLASLRFQVRVLDDSLDQNNHDQAHTILGRIERAVTDANTELRELIAHFRAPIDRRGLIPAIKAAVDRFREETGVATFMQSQWPETPLEATQEMQILRIIQESLANIRKYAKASAVRVFLGAEGTHLKVIIEDDGIGFNPHVNRTDASGNHIGIDIMKSRAEQLQGELTIDSEPGEGTRVLLKFLPHSAGIVDDSGPTD